MITQETQDHILETQRKPSDSDLEKLKLSVYDLDNRTRCDIIGMLDSGCQGVMISAHLALNLGKKYWYKYEKAWNKGSKKSTHALQVPVKMGDKISMITAHILTDQDWLPIHCDLLIGTEVIKKYDT